MKVELLKIFIVEHDAFYSSMLEHYLSLNSDYQVKKFASAKELLSSISEKPDIVTLDYSLPDMRGDQLFSQIIARSPHTKVIMISEQKDIRIVVDVLKKGVHDYIVKDEDVQTRLWTAIEKLKETLTLQKEIESFKQDFVQQYSFQKVIIGNSSSIHRLFALMEKASQVNIIVSITGETGTGKELVAKSIHFNSPRKQYPFVPVNVAAIPKELLESELFGHEKGSFTGATSRRIGKFEEAHKGTLFLDEIGEMDINMQAKLLRALQEKEIVRVGSNELIKIDARIIVATHKNILEEVKKGNFREDLYYRLLGLPIEVPPLRERGNDIILIATYLIKVFCEENKLAEKHLSVDAKMKLLTYEFPGNIRELKSLIELACIMSDREEISPEHINIIKNNSLMPSIGNHGTLKQFTVRLIQHYLDEYDYDVLKVADLLDIGKSTIYRMVKDNELSLQSRTEKVS